MCYNFLNIHIHINLFQHNNSERKISMDDFNNNENQNFGEESFADKERREEQNAQFGSQPTQNADSQFGGNRLDQNGYDPYNMPFEQQRAPQPQQPYNTSYANNGQQQVPPNFDPYKQPLPQGQYQYNGMYTDPSGMPYKTGLATASLVIGIISLVLTFTGMIYIVPILPIIGIILGCIYKGKHYPVGKGASTAGIICSVISLVLSILFIVLIVYIVMNYMPQVMELLKESDPDVYQQYYDLFHDSYPEWFNTAAALFAKFIIK